MKFANDRAVLMLPLIVALAACGGADDTLESVSGELRAECRPLPEDDSEPRWMQRILTRDHRVDHVSTVTANAGETVQLAVRERVKRNVHHKMSHGKHKRKHKVVLFVHGASIPSVPDFDLRFRDYNWMAHLAADGMDTFAMDVSGFGLSARPKMDDPCNAPASAQLASLMPNPLSAPCPASHPYVLGNGLNEFDEINTVVDYLRELRGVDKVSLVGWSQGGQRVAGYTARHPEKVESLFLFAPQYSRTWPSAPPTWPIAGTPMTIQTRSELFDLRWQPFVKCEGQVEPGVRDAVWQSIMSQDPIGASWGPEGVMRVRSWYNSGWNQSYAVKIQVPTFIIVGEDDANLVGGRQLYEDIPAEKKVLVTVPCASHFMLWEKQHNLLQWTSRRWVKWHSVEGISNGVYRATTDGTIEGMGGPANDCAGYHQHDDDCDHDHDD